MHTVCLPVNSKCELFVDAKTRLNLIRERLAVDWNKLGMMLGVSRSLLHAVRTGARAVSPKMESMLRELEVRANLRTPESIPSREAVIGRPLEPTGKKAQTGVTAKDIERLENLVKQIVDTVADLRRRFDQRD